MKHKSISANVKREILSKYNNRCINCGSTEHIEFHHVVPLEIGGYDIESNIVPLCYHCHKAVTNHELILKTSGRPHKSGGRKRIIPEDYEEILGRYTRCEIGKGECRELLGLSKSNSMTDNTWYKEYLEKNGIKKFRNNIDMLMANHGINTGGCIGIAIYQDGTNKRYFWEGEPIVGSGYTKRSVG